MKTATTLALVALALIVPTSALADCGRAADVDPAAPGASMSAAGRATLCLLNVQRVKHHERRLRANRKLALAGTRHARDMVKKHYFSHTALSGQTFVARIMKTSYVPRSASWLLGENLAWGSENKATPRQIVRAWMASPEHRHNILTASFRQIGVAIVGGAPVRGVAGAATYATEFGAVQRH